MKFYTHRLRRATKPNQAGFIRLALVVFVVLIAGFFIYSLPGHALDDGSVIKAGTSSDCLDVRHNSTVPGTAVDSWGCNNSDAQRWNVTPTTIVHDNECLSITGNAITVASPVTLSSCSDAAGQVWLRDKGGFENPNSGLCLATNSSSQSVQVGLATCSGLGSSSETWTLDSTGTSPPQSACNHLAEGPAVACYAAKEWTTWQSNSPSHVALLTQYTDGAPYEEWCADFVSYVYKEAGYPFTGGETDGWDEDIAGNIQNMSFVKHSASNYTPQPGDVAFFDYPGGHVEIVVSGGKHPTYIYGDSATIDPASGNGDMEANAITSDQGLGQVTYYLSPVQPAS